MKLPHTPQSRGRRGGFSLIETVLAASISALTLVSLLTFFVGSKRFMQLTFARAEFAIQARQLRDRLLFHPPGTNAEAPGLLSASSVSAIGATTRQLTTVVTGLSDAGITNVNALTLSGPWRQLDYSFAAPGTTLSVSNRLYVNIVGEIDVGGLHCFHGERVVVPLFGRAQPAGPNQGGDL